MAMEKLALGRETITFMVEETDPGTLVEPSATDLILTTDVPKTTQARETFDDEQKRDTRSKLVPIAGRYLAGQWSFATYLKPSGTAGTAPAESILMEGLLGKKVISGGVSVTYSPDATSTHSYSLWHKDGHTVFFCTGCTIDKGEFTITGKDPVKATWSGGLMKMLWTGTDSLSVAISDTTSVWITPVTIDNFSVGSIIKIDNEIMKVTTVGASNLQVTRGYKSTTPATHLINSVITPWLPTGTETGNIVHGRLGTCTLNAVAYNIMSSTITITNGIKYYEEEKNGQDFATVFGTPVPRTVEAKVSVYFRKGDTARFNNAYDFDSLAFVIPAGNVPGKIVTINIPQAKIKAPDITGDNERMQELQILPFATTNYNDEINIVYT